MKLPIHEAEKRKTGAHLDAGTKELGERSVGRRLREWGCVHGRFQPFHNGHLEYTLRAKYRCQRLVVGITSPDPTWMRAEVSSPHRHEPGSNPFTYFERVLMIRETLLAEGLSLQEFVIVPFPIHDPKLCRHYEPAEAVHYVRVYSDWEREKVRRLQSQGLTVEILDAGKDKETSGAEVRHLMRSGLPWVHLVPNAVSRVIHETLATDRLRL
jgi:cytidyltransferase-like protein